MQAFAGKPIFRKLILQPLADEGLRFERQGLDRRGDALQAMAQRIDLIEQVEDQVSAEVDS